MTAGRATPSPPAHFDLGTPRRTPHIPNTSKTYKQPLATWTPNAVAIGDAHILVVDNTYQPSHSGDNFSTGEVNHRTPVNATFGDSYPLDSDWSSNKQFMPNKSRPRGESDLGRPALRVRRESNGYGFPAIGGGDSPLTSLNEQPPL